MMEDFTAGHISQTEADKLIVELNRHVGGPSCTFHGGLSYRSLVVATLPSDFEASCTPPHDFPGQPVVDRLPRGAGAAWILDLNPLTHRDGVPASSSINRAGLMPVCAPPDQVVVRPMSARLPCFFLETRQRDRWTKRE